ncbi:MAG: MFS transporter, partial [Armatimonadetes bacterium]|nr:MFS transporter [Armatimonadota bacterium]
RRVILFTAFLDVLSFSIIIPQLAVYAAQFGASAQMTGALASIYSVMGFLFAPFWGRLSDRRGRRPILLYSIFGTAIGHLIFAFATALPLLFAARVIDGITGANISTAQAYLSDITEPEERARNFGFFGAIFGIAFAIGPLLGSALTHLPGIWGGNFGLGMVSALLSLLNWALALKFLPETLSPQLRAQNAANNGEGRRSPFDWRAFERALKVPRLGTVIVIGFLATAAFATIQGTYALFILKDYTRPLVQREIRENPADAIARAQKLRDSESQSNLAALAGSKGSPNDVSADATAPYPPDLGGDFHFEGARAPEGLSWRHIEKLIVRPESARLVGTIFGIIGILSLVVQGGLIRPLQKRFSELSLVLMGTFIMAMGLMATTGIAVILPHIVWGQFIAAAILTLGNGLATPVLTGLVSQLSPERERGEIMGIYQSTQSLGRIAGPNLGGWLFGAVSSGAPFIAGGLIMLASFFLALKLRGGRKEAPATAPAQ